MRTYCKAIVRIRIGFYAARARDFYDRK